MNVLIVGYPYIKEDYIRTFEGYPKPEDLGFLLPRSWKAKGGKIVYKPSKNTSLNILKTQTYFYHSGYPLVGGSLKGWMPALPFYLWSLKRKGLKLVFSASEPILLSTLWNGFWVKFFSLKHVLFSWENIPFEEKLKGPRGLLQKHILRQNIRWADGIICGNKKCHDIFRNLTDKPIAGIPISGIDESLFKPGSNDEFRAKYNLKDKVVFTFAGAIGYRKGIHVALWAFKKVLQRYPSSRFVIAGSGEYEDEINRLIKFEKVNSSLKTGVFKDEFTNDELGNYVIRIPWIKHDKLPELFNASDVFLYPSLRQGGWEEQFGYSMAEASLCELPVVATHSGSIDEVVVDGKTGILVEENNVERLAEAMIKLAQDEELRKSYGKAGRNYIINHFSNKKIAHEFYNFFKTLF
ncbi:MAG: glycosyltransferase family 4 protein [bacterium]|nr:glycosyltransferase family 4 protein [bacterium]